MRNLFPPNTVEQIAVMRCQEDTIYRCKDYFGTSHRPQHEQNDEVACPPASSGLSVDEECREKICNWLFQLIDAFKLSRDVVLIAMTYLDRFLASSSSSQQARFALYNRKEYQLAAITCLYMAMKLHERKAISPSELAFVTHGVYSGNEISAMEMEILFALEWRLSGPTMLDFVQQFLALLPPSSTEEGTLLRAATMMEHCRQQSEHVAREYSFVLKKPSVVAIASICNAMEEVGMECFKPCERSAFLRIVSNVSGTNPHSKEVQNTRLSLVNKYAKDNCTTSSQGYSESTLSACNSGSITDEQDDASSSECQLSSPNCVSGDTAGAQFHHLLHTPTRRIPHFHLHGHTPTNHRRRFSRVVLTAKKLYRRASQKRVIEDDDSSLCCTPASAKFVRSGS